MKAQGPKIPSVDAHVSRRRSPPVGESISPGDPFAAGFGLHRKVLLRSVSESPTVASPPAHPARLGDEHWLILRMGGRLPESGPGRVPVPNVRSKEES